MTASGGATETAVWAFSAASAVQQERDYESTILEIHAEAKRSDDHVVIVVAGNNSTGGEQRIINEIVVSNASIGVPESVLGWNERQRHACANACGEQANMAVGDRAMFIPIISRTDGNVG